LKNLIFLRQRICVCHFSAAYILSDLQDVQAKNIPSSVISKVVVDMSEIVFFPSLEMTDIGMAF
jgi:hypothetical protein